MPKDFKLRTITFLCLSAALLATPLLPAAAADDDEPINLSPVKKEAGKPVDDPTPVAAATAVAVATAVATVAPTVAPTPTFRPTPRPAKKTASIEGISFSQDASGIKILVHASAAIHGRVSALKNPDR